MLASPCTSARIQYRYVCLPSYNTVDVCPSRIPSLPSPASLSWLTGGPTGFNPSLPYFSQSAFQLGSIMNRPLSNHCTPFLMLVTRAVAGNAPVLPYMGFTNYCQCLMTNALFTVAHRKI